MAHAFDSDVCNVARSVNRNRTSVPSVCRPTRLAKRTHETNATAILPPTVVPFILLWAMVERKVHSYEKRRWRVGSAALRLKGQCIMKKDE
jgi:hypothetical protein